MRTDERGMAGAIEILLVVVVLGVIGFVGYRVVQSHKPKAKTAASTAATETAKEQTWKEGGFAVAGTYADASVLQVGDKQWRMYYGVQPEVAGNQLEVYSATSTDGKTWTQEAGTRKTRATFPEVVKLADGRYRMYYQGAGVLKSAISTDGLSFTDEAGTRMDTANDEGLVFDNVAAPSVVQKADGTFVMVYRGSINTRYAANTPNPSTQLLMWATSANGLTFTQKGIAVDSRTSTLNGQLDGPDLVKWDDGYRLFATTYTGVYQFSFDGAKFGAPTLALAGEAKKTDMGFTGAPPGDPTTAKIDGTWFMYYGGPHDQNGIHYATLQ
ncbi:MAG TPA: hypothetical protein VLF40_05860 [Candidatus Saccharimonadales bacterium]|nr:hypothetical protein [Candidatus Saccharimonadales bacterium]